jgi:predicted ribosomally synthesized peptide with nif11-like leader
MSEESALAFMRELAEDEELENALYSAVRDQPDRAAAIALWAVHRGYRFTAADFVAILRTEPGRPEELRDEDLDHVAGGVGDAAQAAYSRQIERMSRFVLE